MTFCQACINELTSFENHDVSSPCCNLPIFEHVYAAAVSFAFSQTNLEQYRAAGTLCALKPHATSSISASSVTYLGRCLSGIGPSGPRNHDSSYKGYRSLDISSVSQPAIDSSSQGVPVLCRWKRMAFWTAWRSCWGSCKHLAMTCTS